MIAIGGVSVVRPAAAAPACRACPRPWPRASSRRAPPARGGSPRSVRASARTGTGSAAAGAGGAARQATVSARRGQPSRMNGTCSAVGRRRASRRRPARRACRCWQTTSPPPAPARAPRRAGLGEPRHPGCPRDGRREPLADPHAEERLRSSRPRRRASVATASSATPKIVSRRAPIRALQWPTTGGGRPAPRRSSRRRRGRPAVFDMSRSRDVLRQQRHDREQEERVEEDDPVETRGRRTVVRQ